MPVEVADVELVPITHAELPILSQLAQLYAYDFSELIDIDVGADGRFPFSDLDVYWTDAWRHPYFIRADGHLAGFVLLHTRSYFDANPCIRDVAEFFVMRRYRRSGVGARAAAKGFQRFDGAWEVRVRDTNPNANAFWRKAIEAHTHERFRETEMNDQTWRGTVYRFGGPP